MKTVRFICLFLSANIFISCYNPKYPEPTEQKCQCSNSCWMTVGSVGVIDEMAREAVELGSIRRINEIGDESSSGTYTTYEDMSIHLKDGVSPGKYSIRYPVSPLSSVLQASDSDKYALTVNFKLTDPTKDRITIYLKEYDLLSPSDIVKVIATFSSADSSANPQDTYIERTANIPHGFPLNIHGLYYLEVVLETNRIPGRMSGSTIGNGKITGPSVAAIRLCHDVNI